jgi:hypothetical protein
MSNVVDYSQVREALSKLTLDEVTEQLKNNPRVGSLSSNVLTGVFVATMKAVLNAMDAQFAPDDEAEALVPPCLVCGKALKVLSAKYNQADNANDFSTSGQYGSTVFDSMDGTRLHVNVCDECIVNASHAGRVLEWNGEKLVPWEHANLRSE